MENLDFDLDFNSFTFQIVDYELDSANYTFSNAPTEMAGAFRFYTSITQGSAILQQTVIMNSSNVIYTREISDGEFSDWITPASGSIPKSTFFAQTGTGQTVTALLAAQIPPITDKVGNLYIVTNTSNDYIKLLRTLTGSFLGYGGFVDCSSTDLVIPPLGVAVFATLAVDADNANTYQIMGVSNNSNINGISVSASGDLESIFTDFGVIDKVQNMYQLVNTTSDAISINSTFTNFDSWVNCTNDTLEIPGNGSALILTSVANSTYSIVLTSAGLSLPTTPIFTTVTITESFDALAIGTDGSQSIFSSNATTDRTVTLPDANTVTVQPGTVASGNYVTGIDSNGAITSGILPVLPTTPIFATVTITESFDALAIGTSESQSIFSSNATTNRAVTLPDANSVTVQPGTAATSDYVKGIDSNGAITFGTLPVVPNTSTSFSPADNSGSVSIVNNGSFYNQFGDLIFANVNVNYPDTTGNTDNASIILTGLGNAFSSPVPFIIFTAALATIYFGTIAAGSNVISIYDKTGNPVTNADLSSQNLIINPLIYAIA